MKNTEFIHLGLSGGATKVPFLGAVASELLRKGYKPNIISGISSGSIMTFVLCASSDPIKTIEENATTFKISEIFENPPFNKTGKITIRAIYNALTKNYLAKQDKMEDKLRQLVSRDEWETYLKNDDAPIGVIMATDYITGSRHFVKLKEVDYDTAIKMVRASCSIPVFSNPVIDGDKVLYDGGARDHIIGKWIIDNYNITECKSIFTRPENFKDYINKDNLKKIFGVFSRSFDIMLNETSKTDEILERQISTFKDIDYKAYYLKENPLKNFYDDSKESLDLLYQLGIEEVNNKGL